MPSPITSPGPEFGALVEARRIAMFGAKSAAYTAAGISAPTWDSIEAGRPVRKDRLIAAVRLLWPSSGGDWRKVDPDEPVPTSQPGDARSLQQWSDAELIAELAARLARK